VHHPAQREGARAEPSDDRGHLRLVGDIGRDHLDDRPEGLQFTDQVDAFAHRRGQFGGTPVRPVGERGPAEQDQLPRAVPRQPTGEDPADAAEGAGDQVGAGGVQRGQPPLLLLVHGVCDEPGHQPVPPAQRLLVLVGIAEGTEQALALLLR